MELSESAGLTAVISVDGKQYKVKEGARLLVDKREVEPGQEFIFFEQVLLLENAGKTKVGAPYIKNASVKAQVLGEVKGEKGVAFKKKRRKGYAVKTGYRKHHLATLIVAINEGGRKSVT